MFSNFLANLCIVVVDDHRMYFFRMSNFTASVNCETGNCLVYKPILYESAMFCMDLHVANLGMTTATFTWTGIADRMLVSCLCIEGARVEPKNSNVETSIRIRPLSSLALNDLSKFRSKKPGCYNPISWADKPRGLSARAIMKTRTAIAM